MILVDANLLIYAHGKGFPQHALAANWLQETIATCPRIGLPWSSVLSFVRIFSNPRVIERPPSVPEAWKTMRSLLALDSIFIPQPEARHEEFLSLRLAQAPLPRMVTDAHLAALADEHGLAVYSSDGDFARFPGLRWVNPLAPT